MTRSKNMERGGEGGVSYLGLEHFLRAGVGHADTGFLCRVEGMREGGGEGKREGEW
jgi:hypothetical protein